MHKVEFLGVGSPIVDTLGRVSDAFIASLGVQKGTMTYVDDTRMADTVAKISNAMNASGGSSGNTASALARLGTGTSMIGKVGDDDTGRFFRRSLIEAGASDSRLKQGKGANARCLCMATPDGERTMFTNLGAAATICEADVTEADFSGIRAVKIEGYLIYNKPVFERVISLAHKAGAEVMLDLGSFNLVESFRDAMLEVIGSRIDIVACNHDEARALLGDKTDETLALELNKLCKLAIVNRGAEGSLIAKDGKLHHIAPRKIEDVVDTTSAGDHWMAGFLHAYLRGADLDKCGQCGTILGSETVRFMGTALDAKAWAWAKAEIARILG
jgi:sugar/nucleoside kinase (ribokinase family)